MITIENISKIIGDEYLLKNVNLTINENDKLGIVGKNGVGKTTLLKIIENDEMATDGKVLKGRHTVEYLSQEKQLVPEHTVFEEMEDVKQEFKQIEQEMNELVEDPNFAADLNMIERYGRLENKYTHMGGYEIDSRIQKIFALFGFTKETYSKKISDFSGGEKTRMALVKLILKDPDYLILDEPTNHLDVATIEWLEDYLRLKARGVIVVSHDRFFLERVCNKIVEIEHKTTHEYKMKYSKYHDEKIRRYDYDMNAYNNQQMEIKKLEDFIDKNKKRASKIGQVKDRKKKLEQMELIEKPLLNTEKVQFEIEGFRLKKAPYVDLIDASIGYDEQSKVLEHVDFTIRGGDRIGITGENGAGKTTLIKSMTKEIKPLDGRVVVHPKIKIGYFEQEQTSLDEDEVVYDMIEKLMPGESQTMIRKHLAKFLFKGSDVYKRVNVLSGGEKVRLIFASFVLKKYDMIIMDEPTNHLDVSAKEELEEVLKQYTGTLVVISHDRYFLNQIVNKIFHVENKQYTIHEGNYEDYLQNKVEVKSTTVEKKQKKVREKKQKKRNTVKLEKKIEQLETDKDALNAEVLKEEVYSDWQKLSEIETKIKTIEAELELLYTDLLGE